MTERFLSWGWGAYRVKWGGKGELEEPGTERKRAHLLVNSDRCASWPDVETSRCWILGRVSRSRKTTSGLQQLALLLTLPGGGKATTFPGTGRSWTLKGAAHNAGFLGGYNSSRSTQDTKAFRH